MGIDLWLGSNRRSRGVVGRHFMPLNSGSLCHILICSSIYSQHGTWPLFKDNFEIVEAPLLRTILKFTWTRSGSRLAQASIFQNLI